MVVFPRSTQTTSLIFRKSNEFVINISISIILCYLNFQIYVSYFTVFLTVWNITEFWIHPKKNILGETGCSIAILVRNTGFLQIQLHSFIMATTRYIFVFHSNLLLKLNLTTNVSATMYMCNIYRYHILKNYILEYLAFFSVFLTMSFP